MGCSTREGAGRRFCSLRPGGFRTHNSHPGKSPHEPPAGPRLAMNDDLFFFLLHPPSRLDPPWGQGDNRIPTTSAHPTSKLQRRLLLGDAISPPRRSPGCRVAQQPAYNLRQEVLLYVSIPAAYCRGRRLWRRQVQDYKSQNALLPGVGTAVSEDGLSRRAVRARRRPDPRLGGAETYRARAGRGGSIMRVNSAAWLSGPLLRGFS